MQVLHGRMMLLSDRQWAEGHFVMQWTRTVGRLYYFGRLKDPRQACITWHLAADDFHVTKVRLDKGVHYFAAYSSIAFFVPRSRLAFKSEQVIPNALKVLTLGASGIALTLLRPYFCLLWCGVLLAFVVCRCSVEHLSGYLASIFSMELVRVVNASWLSDLRRSSHTASDPYVGCICPLNAVLGSRDQRVAYKWHEIFFRFKIGVPVRQEIHLSPASEVCGIVQVRPLFENRGLCLCYPVDKTTRWKVPMNGENSDNGIVLNDGEAGNLDAVIAVSCLCWQSSCMAITIEDPRCVLPRCLRVATPAIMSYIFFETRMPLTAVKKARLHFKPKRQNRFDDGLLAGCQDVVESYSFTRDVFCAARMKHMKSTVSWNATDENTVHDQSNFALMSRGHDVRCFFAPNADKGNTNTPLMLATKEVPSFSRLNAEWAIELARAVPTYPEKYWCTPPPGSSFDVRSATYLFNKVKSPSMEAPFELAAVDLFLHSKHNTDRHKSRGYHVASHASNRMQITRRKMSNTYASFTFVACIVVPGPLPYTFAMYFVARDPLALRDCGTPFGRLASKFFFEDDNFFRDSRFKLIPRIVDANWVVKHAVGSTPAILGKKLKQHYYRGPDYFEIDIDIASSSVAAGVLRLCGGYARTLITELAFVLEGQHILELPEQVLAAIRITHLNFADGSLLLEC